MDSGAGDGKGGKLKRRSIVSNVVDLLREATLDKKARTARHNELVERENALFSIGNRH